ncbi:MAG TPA: RagB/SusD family nutrient uptake outer membrane protein, partial [Fodinibius sp.]|nr:RagB/SusD family nutrient uptake outer membrane protein [Fodinibius sp.]
NYQPDPLIFDTPPLEKGGTDMSTTGYMIRKGSTPDPDQNQGSSSSRYGEVDGMVFRYAEVLMNYAEAKAELGTLTQADLDQSINLIRERAGMPPLSINVGFTDPDWNFPDLSPIINEIRRERRIELALEGFRDDDLMRWAAADEIIQGSRWKGAKFIPGVSFPEIEDQISNIPVDENNYIDRYQNAMSSFGFDASRDYLYPIPTNEISLNDSLTQNPGW